MMKLVSLLMMLFVFTSPAWAAQTLLLTQATVNGSSANPGDVFQVNVSVTNVGSVTAFNVRGDIRNIPATWIVTPANTGFGVTNGTHVFGNLAPGQSARVTYTVTRDTADAGPIMPNTKHIWSRVFADNAPVAESRDIEVPVLPIVSGLLAASMVGGAVVLARAKR